MSIMERFRMKKIELENNRYAKAEAAFHEKENRKKIQAETRQARVVALREKRKIQTEEAEIRNLKKEVFSNTLVGRVGNATIQRIKKARSKNLKATKNAKTNLGKGVKKAIKDNGADNRPYWLKEGADARPYWLKK